MEELKKHNVREEQRLKTKSKILKTALKQFSTLGYHATSVRTIHKESEVQGNLLYHYFPGGKEELLKVISEDAINHIENQLQETKIIIESLPIEDVLEVIYQEINHIFTKYFEEIKLILIKLESVDASAKDKLIDIIKAREMWLPEFLKQRISKGEIKPIDYRSSAHIVTSIFFHHFMVLLSGMTNAPLSNERERKGLFNHLVRLWKGQ